jgi:hypothetical protein
LFTTTTTALVGALVKAHVDARLEECPAFCAKPKLLIVDERGYLPFGLNAKVADRCVR